MSQLTGSQRFYALRVFGLRVYQSTKLHHQSSAMGYRSWLAVACFLAAMQPNSLAVANDTYTSNAKTIDRIENTTAQRDYRLDELTSATLNAIAVGHWNEGLTTATELVNEFPDFSLGHWLLAETHRVLASSGTLMQTLPNYSRSTIDILLEAQARAQLSHEGMNDSHPAQEVAFEEPLLPQEIIQSGKHVETIILVDLATSTLYHFDTRAKQPQLIRQHYISSGEGGFGKHREGDLKTPLGVYRIYGFRSDESLPDLYGAGALMLNYPNTLDRSLGRSGSGIWLHGNPRADRSRSPRSSEGCVTMANDHLLSLHKQINIERTQVILSHNVQWQRQADSIPQRDRFHELFEQYRAAWVNNNVEDLFSLYAIDALPANVQHADRGRTKKVSSIDTNSASLSPVGIALDPLSNVRAEDLSLLLNPDIQPPSQHDNSGHTQHLVMSFELPDSNNAQVTLYWEREPGTGYWKIKRETIDAGGA